MFIVRNSWGDEWCDKGYCYVPYDYLANPAVCDDAWIVKGHVTGEHGDEPPPNLSEGVWCDPDEDFGPEFYEEYDEPQDKHIFTLNEAIGVLCCLGVLVDGATREPTSGRPDARRCGSSEARPTI